MKHYLSSQLIDMGGDPPSVWISRGESTSLCRWSDTLIIGEYPSPSMY